MSDNVANKLGFLIKEFEKLKDEQHIRINFRDQMIFVTLGIIGAVFSFVLEKPDYITVLLVLPVVCIVLGWTYLVNDEKITEIGTYCRDVVISKIQNLDPESSLNLYPSWEDFHRSYKRRKERKTIQLIVDICLFCISALSSLIFFFYLKNNFSIFHVSVAIIESLLISYLIYQFISYSSLRES